jgi:transposase
MGLRIIHHDRVVVSKQSVRHNMWTEITRPKYERAGRRYASDLTDAEWRLIEPFMPPARIIIQALHDLFPWLRHLFADSVYNGPNLCAALAKFGNWTIEIVTRAAGALGFQLLPRRWVVERTLAWLNRNRRLAKDFETSIASATTWIYIASIQLLIRRLAYA